MALGKPRHAVREVGLRHDVVTVILHRHSREREPPAHVTPANLRVRAGRARGEGVADGGGGSDDGAPQGASSLFNGLGPKGANQLREQDRGF